MGLLTVLGYVAFLAVGLFQLFAIADGLEAWLGLPGFLAMIGGFFLAYIPLLGSLLGVLAAVYVWQWSWVGAILLFFGISIAAMVLSAGVGGASVLGGWLTRRKA